MHLELIQGLEVVTVLTICLIMDQVREEEEGGRRDTCTPALLTESPWPQESFGSPEHPHHVLTRPHDQLMASGVGA